MEEIACTVTLRTRGLRGAVARWLIARGLRDLALWLVDARIDGEPMWKGRMRDMADAGHGAAAVTVHRFTQYTLGEQGEIDAFRVVTVDAVDGTPVTKVGYRIHGDPEGARYAENRARYAAEGEFGMRGCCNPRCRGEWGTGCFHCHSLTHACLPGAQNNGWECCCGRAACRVGATLVDNPVGQQQMEHLEQRFTERMERLGLGGTPGPADLDR